MLGIYRLSKLFYSLLYTPRPRPDPLCQLLGSPIIQIQAQPIDDRPHLAGPVRSFSPSLDNPPIDTLHDAGEVMGELVGKGFRVHEPPVGVFQWGGRADVGQEMMSDVRGRGRRIRRSWTWTGRRRSRCGGLRSRRGRVSIFTEVVRRGRLGRRGGRERLRRSDRRVVSGCVQGVLGQER